MAAVVRHSVLTERYTRMATSALESEIAHVHQRDGDASDIRIIEIGGRYRLRSMLGFSQLIPLIDEKPIVRVRYSDGDTERTRYFSFRLGYPRFAVTALIEMPAWMYYLNLRL